MALRLEQAICLSLAGGFAVIAPPTFPRTREIDARPDAQAKDEQQQPEERTGETRNGLNRQSRNRSRTAS